MPVIKSAKKKLRQDKKRRVVNKKAEDLFRIAVKNMRKNPSEKNLREAMSVVDRAAKKHIIHRNKAARIKSSLSKLVAKKSAKPVSKTVVAKPAVKVTKVAKTSKPKSSAKKSTKKS